MDIGKEIEVHEITPEDIPFEGEEVEEGLPISEPEKEPIGEPVPAGRF